MEKNEGAWETLAPSGIAFKEGDPAPKEMSKAEIEQLVKDFVHASERALEAGFEVFEIHAAHGYLVNEFLSPISNARTDEQGGLFENRIRLLMQIVAVIREVIGNGLPLFVRISATDWVDGGWDVNESVALARTLKDYGVDVIDCSSGGNSHKQKIPVAPMYQVPFSEKLKKNRVF